MDFLTLSMGIGLSIILMAFIAEYVDSTLGMGYGTTLTPILLLMGFSPMQIVPCILLSELFTGFAAGFTHHAVGNAELIPKRFVVQQKGLWNNIKSMFPKNLKVALILALCSIVGTVSAVYVAVNIPKFYLKMYIGILVFVIGISILLTINKTFKFSWKKIIGLGLLASFNKGMSGGGYGPVVTGGQLLSGVNGKNAIAITSLAEGLTCLVGLIMYFIIGKQLDWSLAPYLIIGAMCSVPLSAISVKVIKTSWLRWSIGIFMFGLGAFTIYKVATGGNCSL